MDNFQNLLLRLALLLMILLLLAQGLLIYGPSRKILSRAERLEGRPWQPLASALQDVLN